jgi:hypothetical protein
MAECRSCGGTGKCQQCRGTGHFGYRGSGPLSNYPNPAMHASRQAFAISVEVQERADQTERC